MTRQTFYRTLKKVADQFEWKIEEYGRGWIRGVSKYNNQKYCPLTAVYLAKTGITICMFDFKEASTAMGVKEKDSITIANAADNDCEVYKHTRKAILHAIGKI